MLIPVDWILSYPEMGSQMAACRTMTEFGALFSSNDDNTKSVNFFGTFREACQTFVSAMIHCLFKKVCASQGSAEVVLSVKARKR